MSKHTPIAETPATPHFDFLYGRYHLSSWAIPYFSTVMSLRDAASCLRLASDFAGSDEIQWRLDELYQREVDWPRVERQIVPYLRDLEQPQFFNSLTIALLPTGHSLSDTEHAFSAERSWQPPGLGQPDRFEKILNVGPISCGYWSTWSDFATAEARSGQIRWNPDEVFAVALDGQHRLAAIQQFVTHPRVPPAPLRATSVPVIFVVLDPQFGYEAPGARSLVDVLRGMFIDLNQHAKIPSRARRILLDDRDPFSVCVRALVGETVTGDIADLDATPPRLPLALVDWHTEQAKFDDGPYVTTILALDWAVSALLGAKPVRNFMDYGAIRNQVKVLSRWLKIRMDKAYERLENLESVKLQPFSYSDSPDNDELDLISTAFQRFWNPAFISLLTEFSPYSELIELRRVGGTLTLDFSNWYRLYHQQRQDPYDGRATQEYNQFVGRLQLGERPIGEEKLRRLFAEIEAHKRSLALNVVFQRAYFLAFREWIRVQDADLYDLEPSEDTGPFDEDTDDEEDEVPPDATEESDAEAPHAELETEGEGAAAFATEIHRRTGEFLSCLNAVVECEPDILQHDFVIERDDGSRQRFWAGTLSLPDETIDFTQGASNRAKEILFWIVAMQMYTRHTDPGAASDFEAFWGETLEPEWLSYMKRVKRSVDRFTKEERSAGGRILKAKGDEFDEDASREEARWRMEWLWTVLEL